MASDERNIILIVLDSVRQDVFKQFAPRIQNKADICYNGCRAVSGWSTPSHASMFTGQLPSSHGVHAHSERYDNISPQQTFLGDIPKHFHVGVSANSYVSSSFGADSLFDEFVDVNPFYRRPDGISPEDIGSGWKSMVRSGFTHPIDSTLNLAYRAAGPLSTWLPIPKLATAGAKTVLGTATEHTKEEPFLLFANLMDAHWPLMPVRGFDHDLHGVDFRWDSQDHLPGGGCVNPDVHSDALKKYQRLYNSSVDYLDNALVDFVEDIFKQCTNETTVIITSDHGDNFGEESADHLFGHKGSLSEGLLHVPMLIINPPEGDYAKTIENNVSHLDIPKLVNGIAQQDVPDISRDSIPAERVGSNQPADTAMGNHDAEWWDRHIRVLYKRNQKYQWDSTGFCGIYSLNRGQANIQRFIRETDECEEIDKEWFDVPIEEYSINKSQSGPPVDETTKQRLKQLGYR